MIPALGSGRSDLRRSARADLRHTAASRTQGAPAHAEVSGAEPCRSGDELDVAEGLSEVTRSPQLCLRLTGVHLVWILSDHSR